MQLDPFFLNTINYIEEQLNGEKSVSQSLKGVIQIITRDVKHTKDFKLIDPKNITETQCDILANLFVAERDYFTRSELTESMNLILQEPQIQSLYRGICEIIFLILRSYLESNPERCEHLLTHLEP